MIEGIFMTIAEIEREFPAVKGWFEDPEHFSAQLQGDKRLMTVQEKLAYLGGKDQVIKNIASIRDGRVQYTMLLACRQDPMPAAEIAAFSRQVEAPFHASAVIRHSEALIQLRQLKRIPNLTTIYRHPLAEPGHLFVGDRIGYLTTEDGLREAARRVATTTLPSGVAELAPI